MRSTASAPHTRVLALSATGVVWKQVVLRRQRGMHSSYRAHRFRAGNRKVVLGLLVASLALTGITVAGLSAANAAETTAYINASGNPASVNATVLSGNAWTHLYLTTGSYVCKETLILDAIDIGTPSTPATVNIILADGCFLAATYPGPGIQPIYIAPSSTLNIYSQSGNTGKMLAGGGRPGVAGISTWATSSTVNIYGGHIWAQGGIGGAGIGGRATAAAGRIKIAGRASVSAEGGNSDDLDYYGAGAGIGSGGADLIRGNGPITGGGGVTVSTTGIVQAWGGIGFAPAANIGTGGGMSLLLGVMDPGIQVNTVKATKSISGTGSAVQYQNWGGEYSDNDPTNVAVGSTITWEAKPAAGYSLTSATGNGVSMGGTGNTRTFPIQMPTATQTAAFVFGRNTTATIAVSPDSPQTRPGNVTVTGTLKTPEGTGVSGATLRLYVNDVLQATTAQTNASGVASFTITSPPVGTYSYYVSWPGNDSSAAQNSPKITGYVVQRATQSALALNGLDVSYTYGDAPLALTTSGGSGTGAVSLVSSDPTVVSLSNQTTAGAAMLTVNRAGTFTLTQKKAQDASYNELVRTTSPVTVDEATPQAVLTRTGGNIVTEPVSVTLQVPKRGTGTTPKGFVQFYFKSAKLGDPLPLVDGGDGTASVSLTGIPLQAMGMQSVTATFLGETGKYTTVAKTEDWYIGPEFCEVELP
jgi:hypothetical protein